MDIRNVANFVNMVSIKEKYLIKWLSFVILKTCEESERREYRKLEKLTTKLIRTICHLRFNETCLNDNLLPTYTNVRMHDDAVRSETFVLEFCRNIIERQISEQKVEVENLEHEVQECK